VKITDTNLFVLSELFPDGATEAPNRIASVSIYHVRRLHKAGLIAVVSRETLALTDDGRAALKAYVERPRGGSLRL
jgi:hypothetical protein